MNSTAVLEHGYCRTHLLPLDLDTVELGPFTYAPEIVKLVRLKQLFTYIKYQSYSVESNSINEATGSIIPFRLYWHGQIN